MIARSSLASIGLGAALLGAPALGAQTAGTLSANLTQRVDSAAIAELSATRTPGSALVIVQGDRVMYAKGYGLASVETGQPVTPELLFRLGSTTKMMTSLAALRLAARGVVDIDRPIGQYAPALASQRLRSVTLRQLLTHTAGLLDYTSMSGPHDDEAMNDFVPTLTDTVFFTDPGDILSYSNLGYVVAGYVLSVATKKPYADVMREEVFTPLGMMHSTMRPIEAMTYPLAQGHQRGSDGRPQVIRPAPDDARYWPAGSAFTTVLDFARLAMAMMNDGRVEGTPRIAPEVVRTWLTPFAKYAADTTANPNRYGFGLTTTDLRGEPVVEHSGSRAGYGSVFRMMPARRVAVIVLGNQSGVALRRTLDAAMAAVISEFQPEPTTRPAPSAVAVGDRAKLLGSYRNARTNGFDIFIEHGELRLRPAGGGPSVPVERIGRDWYMAGNNRFAYVVGADGKAHYLVAGLRAMRKQQ